MDIQWLIATGSDRIYSVGDVLMEPQKNVSYVISHQTMGNQYDALPEKLKRPDVQVYQLEGSGLSINRNHALKKATGEIVVIADDDIRLKPSYAERILKLFKAQKDIDVACFMICTTESGEAYKKYPKEPQYLTTLKALKGVSSIEIAIRRKSIIKKNICFDERFGLGKKADCGEEYLFLASCLKKGLKIYFSPQFVVEHSAISSVNQRSIFEEKRLFVTGAQNYVLYGKIAYLWHFLAMIRRLSQLKKEGIAPIHFLRMKNAGCKYIQNTP